MTPRLVRARLRQQEATLLRAAGCTYEEIAGRLGYRGRGAAYKAVQRALNLSAERVALVGHLMVRIRMEKGLERFAAAVDKGNFRTALATVDRLLTEATRLGVSLC
jgi:hypothetical protein